MTTEPAEKLTSRYAPETYHHVREQIPTGEETLRLAERLYAQVFRTDFDRPGFALVSFRNDVKSLALRGFLLALKDALSAIHREKHGRGLTAMSMLHFDQQNTTKFHLDGAPDESYLLLGYEPTGVQSVLCMADYTRAAHDLGITPRQFLADYNPMRAQGEQRLLPYLTPVAGFDTTRAQVVLINNSSLPYAPNGANSLGVLHQATIPTPDPAQSRVINSMMLAVSDTDEEDADIRAL